MIDFFYLHYSLKLSIVSSSLPNTSLPVILSQVYIAMEHAGHGDLLEYIKLRGAIADDRARAMFKQMASAISYMHDLYIVHR